GHGGILVMSVIRIKQIKLEVLGRAMADLLSVNGHPERRSPRCSGLGYHKARHIGRDISPLALRPDISLQVQPEVEGHLDRISGGTCLEPLQQLLPQKSPGHGNPNLPRPADPRRNLRPHIPEKRESGLSVMHIARAVLHPQQMCRFRQMRRDWKIAGNLAMVRVVASEGAFDLQPRRHDHAIDVDRQRAQRQPRQHMRDHRGVQDLQTTDRLHRKLPQPSAHRPCRWQMPQSAESLKERIILQICQMPQATTTDDDQANQKANYSNNAKIGPSSRPRKRFTYELIKLHRTQILAKQLQTGIRGQSDVSEFQLQISIDTSAQIGFSSSHFWWPFFEVEKDLVDTSFQPQRKAFFNFRMPKFSEKMSHQG